MLFFRFRKPLACGRCVAATDALTRNENRPAVSAGMPLIVSCGFFLFTSLELFAANTRPIGVGAWIPAPVVAMLADGAANASERSQIVLDDVVEPALTSKPRDAVDDRVQAAAFYSAARLSLQNDESARALRLLERSHRCDPSSRFILRQIVTLAFQLGRQDEAIRYAYVSAEDEADDAGLLVRLGAFAAQNRDNLRAIRLFERASEIVAGENPSPQTVEIAERLGRLLFEEHQFARAAGPLKLVCDTIDHPDQFGLNDEQATSLKTSAPLLLQFLGDCYLKSDRPALAAALYRRSHELQPDEAILGCNLANVAIVEGRAEEGLLEIQKYLDARESRVGLAAYGTWAMLLQASGRHEQRLDLFESQVVADPDNAPLALFVAEQLRGANRHDAARRLYRRALRSLSPGEQLNALRGMALLELAAGNHEKLLSCLGEIIGETGQWSSLGEAGEQVLNDRPLAHQLVQLALGRLPADHEGDHGGQFFAAAIIATALDRRDDANRLFESAVDSLPDKAATVLETWGYSHIEAGQFLAAADVYRRAIDGERFPSRAVDFHLYRSSALALGGEIDAALREADLAEKAAPGSVRAAGRAPEILFLDKKLDAAAELYTAVIDRFDNQYDDDELRLDLRLIRLQMSHLETVRGNSAQAEEWLEQVLDEFPDDHRAANDLGYLWADAGKHLPRALRMIEAAVATEPDNYAYRDSLGWVYYRLNRLPEAIAELQRAASQPEPDAEVLEHLGDALNAANRIDEAVDVWTRASTLCDSKGDTSRSAAINAKTKQARLQIAPSGGSPIQTTND